MRDAVKLPTAFTFAQAVNLGLSRRALRALVDSGEVERRARGIYAPTRAISDDPELAAAVLLAPNATICLTSALAHHHLVDAIPGSIDLALPRGTRIPKSPLPVTWHRFAESTFDIGRQTMQIDGHPVGLYDPMRSIVDSFRMRHREGQQGIEALRSWLRKRGSQPAALLEVARAVDPRAAVVIRRVVEILL